jgi:hypothetical protein
MKEEIRNRIMESAYEYPRGNAGPIIFGTHKLPRYNTADEIFEAVIAASMLQRTKEILEMLPVKKDEEEFDARWNAYADGFNTCLFKIKELLTKTQ